MLRTRLRVSVLSASVTRWSGSLDDSPASVAGGSVRVTTSTRRAFHAFCSAAESL